jgi:hypothetical protein
MNFSYSPAATLSREYMSALNISPRNYIGSIASEAVTLNLSTDLEAKMKATDTSSTAEGRKVKVVSLNFSPVTYDIERHRQGHPGFATDRFHYDVSSDLLPGMRFSADYSLFQGDVQSDTAVFKPFRTGINASFSVNNQSGIFAAISRIFGKAVPHGAPTIEKLEPGPDDAMAQRFASTPIAGTSVRNQQYSIPETRGWQASFTYSQSRQRPPTGNGIIIEQDPNTVCAPFSTNSFVYAQCLLQEQQHPSGAQQIGILTQGAAFVRQPPQQFLTSQMSFHITPKWAASWGTSYDFNAHQFSQQQVTLQRSLHDWRSIFAFTRAPNGNFAFNFFIALNADPDIKFNYDKATYRQGQ